MVLALTGCFGGTTQQARPETQLRAETELKRGIRADEKGERLEAEKFLNRSLTFSSSIEDVPARTTALINLARLYRLRHELPKAETCIDQALATTGLDSRLTAEVAYEKALIELAKNSPETALEWARKSIAAEEQSTLLGSRLNLAGRIQLVRGKWSEAAALARNALHENRTAAQAEEEANSLRILGIVARNEKNYEPGMKFLQEALQIDKRIGKSSKIAVDLGELAAISRDAGNLKAAATYLERAYEVNLAGGRLQQARENQGALAEMYTAAGEEPKAIRARETAEKLAARIASQDTSGSSATTNPSNRP